MKTRIFFDILEEDPLYGKTIDYLLARIRNPDPGSEFEKRTEGIRHLSDSELLQILREQDYDAMIAYDGKEICGYVAFQKHEDGLHVFSFYVDEEYRGKLILIKHLIEAFLEYRQREDARVKMSSGNNKQTKSLVNFLALKSKKYRICVNRETCWID